jgi:cell fate (sporulation/competence/biofilm development) regulator YmcA (YheA/YmcA/DUF963 family)
MNLQTPIITNSELKTEADQAARELGELLLHTPEYQVFLKALSAVNNNPAVQKISAEMRSHQNALRWSPKNAGENEAALARLETELEMMPVVQDYRLAEEAVCRMFAEEDTIISQAAGVPFAANAKRSGCGCGG